eukprot:m51a1_g5922 putative serine-threonine protein (776) ;mRNA; r:60450-63468
MAARVAAVVLAVVAGWAAQAVRNDYTETCGSLTDSEVYDSSSAVDKFLPSYPACTEGADDDSGGSIEFVQLFTPRTLPWKYTTVCWKSLFGEPGTVVRDESVRATVVAYDNNGGKPGRVLKSVGVQLTAIVNTWNSNPNDAPNKWYSAPFELTATARSLFIGVTLYGTCSKRTSFFTSTFQALPRRAAWRRLDDTEWTAFAGDWAADNVTSVLFRAKGTPGERAQGLAALVPMWTCDPALWMDGECNCNCGTWDPDCNGTTGTASRNCSSNEVCNRKGSPKSFGALDGCQCGCGTSLDPDCRYTTMLSTKWFPRALNCPGMKVAKCGDSGECVEAWEDPQCPASAFNDKNLCDCRCQSGGVMDPDCMNSALTKAFRNVSSCGEDAHCYLGECRKGIPPGWTCPPDHYGSGDGCHCKCGVQDPDCIQQTGLENAISCKTSSWGATAAWSCTNSSQCVKIGCGNGVVETSLEDCEQDGTSCHDCHCSGGWEPTFPETVNCQPKCGDSLVVGNEECDGGMFCVKCRCTEGHKPLNPPGPACTGCGNKHLDDGEECDGGDGCLDNCKCVGGYFPTSPMTEGCLMSDDRSKGGNTDTLAIAIAVPVGGVALIAGVSVAGVLLFVHKRKMRVPNIPIDMNFPEFVPASRGDVTVEPAVLDASDDVNSAMPLPYIVCGANVSSRSGLSAAGSSGSSSQHHTATPKGNSSEDSDLTNVIVPTDQRKGQDACQPPLGKLQLTPPASFVGAYDSSPASVVPTYDSQALASQAPASQALPTDSKDV